MNTPSRKRWETVVVGAGLAGCEIGVLSLAQGLDTLVVEAGPLRGSTHVAASDSSAGLASRACDPDYRRSTLPSESEFMAAAGYRQRAGGRGLYWRGIVLPIESEVLAEWPDEVRNRLTGPVGLSGSYAAVLAGLREWSAQEARPARAHAEALQAEFIADLERLGLVASGAPRAIRRLPGGRWEAYSALQNLPSDHLIVDQPVGTIIPLDDGRYRLCELGGEPVVEAEKVILAAGTYPNLLLVNGLLARSAESSEYTYQVADHFATGIVLFDQRVSANTGVDSSEVSLTLGFDNTAKGTIFVEKTASATGTVYDTWMIGEQAPEHATEVEVRDGRIIQRLGCAAQQAIRQAISGQLSVLRDVASRLTESIVDDRNLRYSDAERRARARPGVGHVYREPLGSMDHESGGLGLGCGLVDVSGRLEGHPGVYVAGASLFPRAGAANPSLTVLALARGQVQRLINSQGRQAEGA